MKKIASLLFLLLTACTAIAPISTATPTVMLPTPTAIPLTASPTIEPTATPDVITQVLNELQKERINITHEDGADGVYYLRVDGELVPGAYFDKDMQALHVQVGDKIIDVPVSEVVGRLFVSEDGVLGLKGEDGSTFAAFGPGLTTENLAGKWLTESEVFGTTEACIFIGDNIQDHYDYLKAEKLFLEPFPADTYYPDLSKIVRDYDNPNAGDPSTDFTGRTPFGKLLPEDFDKSPFKPGVNCKILKGPSGYMLIISEQVFDPSDPSHIQEFSFTDADDFKTLEEAQKGAWRIGAYRGNGQMILPAHYLMRKDIFDMAPWGKNLLYFLKEMGYADSSGNIDQDSIIRMMNGWFDKGKISPELEKLFLIAATNNIH